MNDKASAASSQAVDTRREFLRNLLYGAAEATVLMVYSPALLSLSRAKESRIWQERSSEYEWAYIIDLRKCIGCGSCVRACKHENNVPAGVFRTWIERYVETDDGVYVDSPNGGLNSFEEVNAKIREKAKDGYFAPKMCNHCLEPPCVQVCPVGATYKSPEGAVLNDEEYCLGCAYCVQACPYGARFINPEKHKSDKCSWCYHRVKNGRLPACVEACPQNVRHFGNLKDPESEVSRILGLDTWMVLQPAMHTEPYCFYIGLPREVV